MQCMASIHPTEPLLCAVYNVCVVLLQLVIPFSHPCLMYVWTHSVGRTILSVINAVCICVCVCVCVGGGGGGGFSQLLYPDPCTNVSACSQATNRTPSLCHFYLLSILCVWPQFSQAYPFIHACATSCNQLYLSPQQSMLCVITIQPAVPVLSVIYTCHTPSFCNQCCVHDPHSDIHTISLCHPCVCAHSTNHTPFSLIHVVCVVPIQSVVPLPPDTLAVYGSHSSNSIPYLCHLCCACDSHWTSYTSLHHVCCVCEC